MEQRRRIGLGTWQIREGGYTVADALHRTRVVKACSIARSVGLLAQHPEQRRYVGLYAP
jgi:hypothetical protein